jgi:hypothetical protein
MVRCISKTVSGKRCKLHRLVGEETCAIHSPMPALLLCENVIVDAPKGCEPVEPKYIQSQAELLVEKKDKQRSWASLAEPELIIHDDEPIPVSNLIVSIGDLGLACGHSCSSITNCGAVDKCCGCADSRPRDSKYMRNVEGVGELNVGLREDNYCITCKGYWATAIPIHERYNCVMNTDVSNNVAPALGAYGLEFCKEIQETIGWLVQMHNALYSRSIELSTTATLDVNENSPF